MVVPQELSEALTNNKSSINSKLIEVSQNDQNKKYSVFEDLQNGSKQKSVAFMVYDLANWLRNNLKTSRNLKKAVTLKKWQ